MLICLLWWQMQYSQGSASFFVVTLPYHCLCICWVVSLSKKFFLPLIEKEFPRIVSDVDHLVFLYFGQSQIEIGKNVCILLASYCGRCSIPGEANHFFYGDNTPSCCFFLSSSSMSCASQKKQTTATEPQFSMSYAFHNSISATIHYQETTSMKPQHYSTNTVIYCFYHIFL